MCVCVCVCVELVRRGGRAAPRRISQCARRARARSIAHTRDARARCVARRTYVRYAPRTERTTRRDVGGGGAGGCAIIGMHGRTRAARRSISRLFLLSISRLSCVALPRCGGALPYRPACVGAIGTRQSRSLDRRRVSWPCTIHHPCKVA